jgi:hypothetical protein
MPAGAEALGVKIGEITFHHPPVDLGQPLDAAVREEPAEAGQGLRTV